MVAGQMTITHCERQPLFTCGTLITYGRLPKLVITGAELCQFIFPETAVRWNYVQEALPGSRASIFSALIDPSPGDISRLRRREKGDRLAFLPDMIPLQDGRGLFEQIRWRARKCNKPLASAWLFRYRHLGHQTNLLLNNGRWVQNMTMFTLINQLFNISVLLESVLDIIILISLLHVYKRHGTWSYLVFCITYIIVKCLSSHNT